MPERREYAERHYWLAMAAILSAANAILSPLIGGLVTGIIWVVSRFAGVPMDVMHTFFLWSIIAAFVVLALILNAFRFFVNQVFVLSHVWGQPRVRLLEAMLIYRLFEEHGYRSWTRQEFEQWFALKVVVRHL